MDSVRALRKLTEDAASDYLGIYQEIQRYRTPGDGPADDPSG